MASTNKTTNYELSQFQSSDIPAWLTDYNGDMQKIDAGIHAAKVQAEGAANGVTALQTTVSGKQDRLTFDDAPTQGSSNPVKSGGVYAALQNVSVETDAVPTAGSTNAVQSGGVYNALQGKQNKLTFDSVPTQGSTNPVTSGGVFSVMGGGINPFGNFKFEANNNEDSELKYWLLSGAFIACHASGFFELTNAAWVAPADAAFPSVNKRWYITGNPFNLPVNSSFPTTQSGIMNMASKTVGNVDVKNSGGTNAYLAFKLAYVSDVNKTYLFGQMSNPASTAYRITTFLLGAID